MKPAEITKDTRKSASVTFFETPCELRKVCVVAVEPDDGTLVGAHACHLHFSALVFEGLKDAQRRGSQAVQATTLFREVVT